MFVDRVEIHVQGGRGGNGCVSFRREFRVPRGGPDGGDGGNGGSVILLAEAGVDSLDALAHRKHWNAGRGEHGSGSNCHGRSAEDLVLKVPPGTTVLDAEAGHVLKDLTAEGEQVTVAKLNIEDSPTTPSRYGVRGIPTMMLFKGGQMASMKVGAMPKQKIVEWLNEAGI